jgi:WD40 repeat protein
VLQDYNEDFIDEWWNILWTPDSKKLIVSGSCKSRHIWDENDHDLKVIPCPVVIFNLEHHLETSKEDTKAQSERGKGRGGESHHHSTNSKSRGGTMPELAREPDFTPQINYSHAGIKRFHGHAEEIVDMKIWHISEQASHRSGSRPIIETLLITSSQDGHIRKWKFDHQWQKLEYSAEMRDETTWMAFSVAQVSFSETNIPQPQQPAGLFLLAGDTTLKLFDLTTNQCLFTFEDIYDAYCTNVELLQLSTGLEHPWMPGIYLNGSGNVYRDVCCSQLVEDFAPTFLVLTKGIDVMAQPKIEAIKKAKGGRASDSEDFDEDDFVPRKSEPKPTRVLLHVLTLPLVSMPRAMPSTSSAKKPEAVTAARRLSVDIQKLELQTVMNFSHPLYDCNYWPSNLTHNGQHVLSVGSKGTVFAWNILQSNVSRTVNVQPYSQQHQHSHQQQVMTGGQGQAISGTGAGLSSNLHQAQQSQGPPRVTINASSHISAILASHEEDSMVRDVIFHPYWPFLFTSSDDASIHVWAPSMFDPGSATPKQSSTSDNPANAHSATSASTAVNPTQSDTTPSLVSQMTTPCIVVPKGATLAFSKMLPNGIPQTGLLHGQQQQQQGSVYRTAIEAAMMASVGSLLPPVAKRKRGRPPKKRIIEEIEAQFAAQERALNAAQQQVQIINPFPDSNA